MASTALASAAIDDRHRSLAHDVMRLRLLIANAYLVGPPAASDRGWVLVDAGLTGTAGWIAGAAAARFGAGARPAAIILTHGHFDHVGAVGDLVERWDVPVYAHRLELPYLSGRAAYPPADPSVGGGVMTWLSPLYPAGPFDLGPRLRPLPEDGTVPGLPDWQAIHSPGHSPGHVALWRPVDRLLLAGDAFVTTKQESALAALAQPVVMHGPPAYFTPDWDAARQSVVALASLNPTTLATGHGRPLRGPAMQDALRALARDFDRVVRPRHGRYVARAALTNEHGVVAVPPAHGRSPLLGAAVMALVAGGALLLWRRQADGQLGASDGAGSLSRRQGR